MEYMWWFIVAAALGVAEIFTLDLTLLMLAGGALAGGTVMLLGGPVLVAVVVACVVASLLLFALRPWLLRSMRSRGVAFVETNSAALVKLHAKTLDEVTATGGRVKLRGEVWSARIEAGAQVIPEGADVVVVKIDGATAIVAPAKENTSL
jgi:membrane protein implicated in regulation of membrane protease activity